VNIQFTKKAQKQFKKLPASLKEKARKQFHFLLDNTSHPSLHVKKMGGLERFEGRVDRQYRFTFMIIENGLNP
jgi:mRNA-degrading endonuclease RelE of RelBE toxin-antitoxin system